MSKFSTTIPPPDSDFWKPHKIIPKKLQDVVVNTPQPIAKSLEIIRSSLFGDQIPPHILRFLEKGKVQDVRGNGKCGIYAILIQLFRRFPQLCRFDHEAFMDQLHPIMLKHGVEEDPRDVDASVLFRFMSEYFQSYYSDDIEHPSFVVFSLSDGTVNFVASSESSSYPANLFVLLHTSDHYKAIILSDSDRRNLFHLLVAHEKS
jgi:hypothetical protein